MIRKVREAMHVFRRHLKEVQAEQKGEARSRARMIKQAHDIPELRKALDAHADGAARPIQGAGVRMLDGTPMQFFSDGSLRHPFGRKVTKAARKKIKRMRHERQAQRPGVHA